jgi:hypothetical protein
VYAASVFIMRKLHLAIPQYRSSHLSDPSSEINKIPVVNWSVEQVCDWVTSKSFKAYRAVFRDGLVNGHMLLTITPEILETVCRHLAKSGRASTAPASARRMKSSLMHHIYH